MYNDQGRRLHCFASLEMCVGCTKMIELISIGSRIYLHESIDVHNQVFLTQSPVILFMAFMSCKLVYSYSVV